jgi:hypothetical protein
MTMTGSMEEIWEEALQQQQQQQHTAGLQQRQQDRHRRSSSASGGAAAATCGMGGLAATIRDWASSAAGAVQQGVARLSGSGAAAAAAAGGAAGAAEGGTAGMGADRTAALVGAGLAVVVAYSVYVERQSIRRGLGKGAGAVRRGLREVMGMALGLSPSPMAAVPNGRHLQ